MDWPKVIASESKTSAVIQVDDYARRYRLSRRETRYGAYNLAEPEKTFLDWIYFKSVDGLPIEIDEFHIDGLDQNRLLEGTKKFSAPVRNREIDSCHS